MGADETWSGGEWEEYCLLLIRRHYGADNVQRVPARHGGDLGIEAYTHSGCALQCYVPQEPLSVNDRYEKQRDKLSRDLAKLEEKQSDLLRLLGDVKIERYLFMVPIFDSHKLVQHATTKTIEYRAKELPHLHREFKITIVNDDAFAEARQDVLRQPRALVEIEPSPPAEVHAWMSANQRLVQEVDGKLQSLIQQQEERSEYIEALITQYVDGSNTLEQMRSRFPDTWELTQRHRVHKERLLSLQHPMASPTTGTVSALAENLQTELSREVTGIDAQLSTVLTWASIAGWLMRCPLRFPRSRTVPDAPTGT